MHRSGTTTDNRPVIAGVARLTTTHGLPLEVLLEYFRERSMVVDWVDYVACCLKDGHNPDTIRSRIETAIADVYGKQHKQAVLARLDLIFCQASATGRPDLKRATGASLRDRALG
jgi:hypothetical protein